jgi:hypothetical protein
MKFPESFKKIKNFDYRNYRQYRKHSFFGKNNPTCTIKYWKYRCATSMAHQLIV